jgi:hypothetical protein
MTLNNPCDHEPDGKRDKHFGMLVARWEGLLERGNKVTIYLNGGHDVSGELRGDNKGYSVWSNYHNTITYIELGDVVAVVEFFP